MEFLVGVGVLSGSIEWEVGVGVGGFPRTPNSNSLLPFSNSNSELELQNTLSSQIIQCLSNGALFVSFRDPVRGFVSEGVAKAVGF